MDPTSTDGSLVIPFALELLVVMMMWTDGVSDRYGPNRPCHLYCPRCRILVTIVYLAHETSFSHRELHRLSWPSPLHGIVQPVKQPVYLQKARLQRFLSTRFDPGRAE